jgi:hypothetical protein
MAQLERFAASADPHNLMAFLCYPALTIKVMLLASTSMRLHYVVQIYFLADHFEI